jgi:chromosome segregation ATPase
MTVGRVRVLYQDQSKQPKQPVSYTDKHGNQKTMNTENIGKKKKERPTTKPDHSLGALDPSSELTQKVNELSTTVTTLAEENIALRDQIAVGQWDASEIEKVDVEETLRELREQVRVLEIENKSLRESRDMYQNRNAELMRSLKSANAKLKKLEG